MCRWLIAAGKRPVPFRTRKLSPPAPMVLPPGGGGRVGYRRPNNFTPTPATHQPRCAAGALLYTPYTTDSRTPQLRIADTALQAPTHSATQTSQRAGRPSPVADNTGNALRTPHLRTADTAGTYALHNTDFPACKTALSRCGQHRLSITDTAAPRCRQRRYLHTPQCGPGSQREKAHQPHCGHRPSALRSPGLPWIADFRSPQYG